MQLQEKALITTVNACARMLCVQSLLSGVQELLNAMSGGVATAGPSALSAAAAPATLAMAPSPAGLPAEAPSPASLVASPRRALPNGPPPSAGPAPSLGLASMRPAPALAVEAPLAETPRAPIDLDAGMSGVAAATGSDSRSSSDDADPDEASGEALGTAVRSRNRGIDSRFIAVFVLGAAILAVVGVAIAALVIVRRRQRRDMLLRAPVRPPLSAGSAPIPAILSAPLGSVTFDKMIPEEDENLPQV